MDTIKKPRGFQTMDAELQRRVASAGGQAAHRKGTAHQFTTEEAREAGRKGGEARAARAREQQARQQANAIQSTPQQGEGLGIAAQQDASPISLENGGGSSCAPVTEAQA